MSSARRREAEHILKACLGDHLRAYEVVERQLAAIAVRGQVVLALSAVSIRLAGPPIWLSAAAVVVLLAAAALAVLGLVRTRWLSQEIDEEPLVTLLRALELRDRRTRNVRNSLVIYVVGLALAAASSLRPLSANRADLSSPMREARNSSAVPRTPKPYFTLRRKSIDEASGK